MAGTYILILILSFVHFGRNFFAVEATIVGGAEDVSSAVVKSQPFSPQVAFQCGYRNRYLSRDGTGEWVADKDPHAGCLTGKLDVLKYCRKVYPDLEITNIVESSHYYQVSNWCKLEGQPCKWNFWVKPYRCIVGAFESEALLVPESCHFGHVDDRNLCKEFDYWNRTAHGECEKRASTPTVKSFAMLEPCGLDMFSGVEFVCCPRSVAAVKTDSREPRIDVNVKIQLDKQQASDANDEDDDDYSDEDDEDDEGSIEEDTLDWRVDDVATPASTKRQPTRSGPRAQSSPSTSPKPPKRPQPTTTTTASDESDEEDDEEDEEEDANTATGDEQDSYFRVADPDREHSEYVAALDRLEKRHRQKVAKVMKEWSELETRYQEMKEKDPNRGEQFRNEMTLRFQRTVSALEAENRDERRQIEEVHQQRVNAALNERKRETMKAFRDALAAPRPQSQHVLRTLQAYIRAEEKDRVHSINRYRRLLRTDSDSAASMKAELTKKFKDIDARINATIEMLSDAPEIEAKVKTAILEFWRTFRDENTPKFVDDSLTRVGDEANGDRLLSSYKKQYQAEFKGKKQVDNEALAFEKVRGDKNGQKSQPIVLSPLDETLRSGDREKTIVNPVVIDDGRKFGSLEEDSDLDSNEASFLEHDDTKQAHAFSLKETIRHEMAMKEEVMPSSSQQSSGERYGYVVLGVAGTTLLVAMLVAIIFVKRRFSARGQGFVEVEACTPEERQVAAMQVNGYENPTYKYFDNKA